MAASQEKCTFRMAADAIDPATVPRRTLWTGSTMPALGLGTFGSDRFTGEQVAAAVLEAASVGYRHFDCASVYGNEHLIGHSFRAILEAGISREDLWVTSKVWNDKHGEGDVIASCEQSLRDLQLHYLDLYLVHWPFPNDHPPDCDIHSRRREAKPYVHDNFMTTWRQMEALVDRGLVRHIGTSNMTIPKLRLVLRDARIKPACNQMELHPHFQQPGLFQFVCEQGMVPIGYCPIGSPNRPDRDRTATDTVDVGDPVIVRIAKRLDVASGVVCIKWAVQRGQAPIPFSVKRAQFVSSLRAVVADPLTNQEMSDIAAIDRNCRLIKGQVFLWRDGQSWEDLWDPTGDITPP